MNEIMMYCGAIGVIFFFILAVILFIRNKIPTTIKYFLSLRKKGIRINNIKEKNHIAIARQEKTEILDEKKNEYEATVLLDEASEANNDNDDSTELLPELR